MTPTLKLDLKKPHQVYKNASGKRLVGVTTVLGTLAKQSLYGWYAAMEREGVKAALSAGSKLPTKDDGKPLWYAEMKRDKAADLGTVTHARIEAWLKGTTLDPEGIEEGMYEQSIHGMERFAEWWRSNAFLLKHSEHQMISEAMQVGGTADVLAVGEDRLALVDIKSTAPNRYWPYPETIAQSAAYANMYAETSGFVVDDIYLVRVGKEPGDTLQVVELTANQRLHGGNLFMGALMAYRAKQELE